MQSDFGARLAIALIGVVLGAILGAMIGFLATATVDVGNKLIDQAGLNGEVNVRLDRLERDNKWLVEQIKHERW